MKRYLEREISKKNFRLNDMLDRIASAASGGMITMDDKAALDAAAHANAHVGNEINLEATVLDLVARVRALEAAQGIGGTTTDAQEYVDGKWYYAGDKVTFGGAVYVCIAPEGAACVWSPAAYPAYWAAA